MSRKLEVISLYPGIDDNGERTYSSGYAEFSDGKSYRFRIRIADSGSAFVRFASCLVHDSTDHGWFESAPHTAALREAVAADAWIMPQDPMSEAPAPAEPPRQLKTYTLNFVETGRLLVSPCCTASIVELREVLSERDYAQPKLYHRSRVAGHGWTGDLVPGPVTDRILKPGNPEYVHGERWKYYDENGDETRVRI
jgi:hypothetical protein